MNEQITESIGLLAGSLTTISFLPQVIKTWKSRSAKDLSLVMFPLFCVGVFLVDIWAPHPLVACHSFKCIHAGAVVNDFIFQVEVQKLTAGALGSHCSQNVVLGNDMRTLVFIAHQ